jgi:hypothetical protein
MISIFRFREVRLVNKFVDYFTCAASLLLLLFKNRLIHPGRPLSQPKKKQGYKNTTTMNTRP